MTVDNFEGVAVVPWPDGRLRFYLISDDNASATQRTILRTSRNNGAVSVRRLVTARPILPISVPPPSAGDSSAMAVVVPW